MSRSPVTVTVALFAVALLAVPTAFAKARDHRAVRIQGVCTQQSTSKLKLSREDRRIEVEFEVDQNQNQNGVPWTVTLRRNGNAITTFTATTRAPSGSFDARRVIAGRLGTDRITAVATRASGETCTADSATPNAKAASATPAADNTADDHGHHSGGHA